MLEINGTKIGKGYKPYIVAELSANHGGDIDRAKESIKAAKEAGASAVKIQTYTPDTMTLNSFKDAKRIFITSCLSQPIEFIAPKGKS